MNSLDSLIKELESKGYNDHWGSPQYNCNYYLGESFLLGLYEILGHTPFAEAWREIYLLNLEKESPVTEQEIYDIFLGHAATDKVGAFNEIYNRSHGGSFKG